MRSENQLVERIVRAVPSAIGKRDGGGICLGIGDDAAILPSGNRSELVLSCDAFLEGVHFLADIHPPESVGYKSLARAASDLAGMGAEPRFWLLTLALPASRTGGWLDGFLRGMARAARLMSMRLVGGDTTKSPIVSIGITVLGQIAPGRALTRAGAQPGDLIYVSGRLGRAQLGLELIRRGLGRKRQLHDVLEPHLYPKIPVALGAWLANRRVASAMMDISDGLSTDLARLCGASHAGARVWEGQIPRVDIPPTLSKRLVSLDPLQMALHGGDDYVLLFTVPPHRAIQLRDAPGHSEVRTIGEMTREKRVLLVGRDGRARRLEPHGWDPFGKK
jgi:thiamine-monophosphate kinase